MQYADTNDARTFNVEQFRANLWEPNGANSDDVIIYRFECDILACQLEGFFRPDSGKF